MRVFMCSPRMSAQIISAAHSVAHRFAHWSILMVATPAMVGYGNTFPVTLLGILLGAIITIDGIGMFTLASLAYVYT